MREALRLMDTHDRIQNMKLEQLRQDIREGYESGAARSSNADDFKREGRKRLNGKKSAKRK